ncbi:MAG: hypothetical protein HLUCCO02_08670 [Idiomarinaceae bacterium HL-53]|nr:MAG: hypothetical protein HLUCCO02_08670 [Idiomarinaceae bacterium HL-53]
MVSKKIPTLHVVFDTNVLFTQVASDLVRASIHKLVAENSNHPDLSITWNLPKTVVGERRFQMLTKAANIWVPKRSCVGFIRPVAWCHLEFLFLWQKRADSL